ncbi:MAG: DivIVA domain-containing protein [Solirubrobacterales bacterium]|nr:DivIVA domain-containing protein [Solirubrobacterales bacterium]
MPDQNSAASEHALMQEITAPLAKLPEDPVPEAANIDFPVVLRGYDRIAVDAYIKKTSQLVAELQATRSPESAVRRAIERVGEEVSGVLQRAHETAEEITSQSRVEAENRLEEARREAAQIVAAAEQRLRDLDAETDRIWAERDRIVEDAHELAGQLTTLASDAAARFAEEADSSTEGETTAEAPEPDESAPAPATAADPGYERSESPEQDVQEDRVAPPPIRANEPTKGRRTIVIPEHPEDFPPSGEMLAPDDELQHTNVMPPRSSEYPPMQGRPGPDGPPQR